MLPDGFFLRFFRLGMRLGLAMIYKHAAHRLVQHMLQVVEVALTDDSTVTTFFYIRYRSPPSRCCEKLESSD